LLAGELILRLLWWLRVVLGMGRLTRWLSLDRT
jgi:hypothetical protein